MSLDSRSFEVRRGLCQTVAVTPFFPSTALSNITGATLGPTINSNSSDSLFDLSSLKNFITSFLLDRDSPISGTDLKKIYRDLIANEHNFSVADISFLQEVNTDQRRRWMHCSNLDQALERIRVCNGVFDRFLASFSKGSIKKFFPSARSFTQYLIQSKNALWSTLGKLSSNTEPAVEKTTNDEAKVERVRDYLPKENHQPFISADLQDLIDATNKSMYLQH